MGPITLTVLGLWSCLLTVTALNQIDLNRATNYFNYKIFSRYNNQYAYFIKFTPEECKDGIQETDLNKVMGEINAEDVLKTLYQDYIYVGKRMVAAAPLRTVPDPNNPRKRFDIHSERRLLDGGNNSPISGLLASAPPAGCVIFFSLNSPCIGVCTDINGPYNIITMLRNTKNLPNNNIDKAFVFRDVWYQDQGKPYNVWESWRALNAEFPLYRCTGTKCIQCIDYRSKKNRCYP